jgi:hypothetical protein
MTREQAIEELKEWQACGDLEIAHGRADKVLCELLKALGCQDVVDEWEKVEKWYA